MTPRTAAATRNDGGFTLVEMLVVMGLLAGFLVMLLQLLAGGVAVFDEGEASQDLSDRTHAVEQVVLEQFTSMAGPIQLLAEGPPDARLIVQWAPLGFRTDPTAAQVQVIRATVHLSVAQEEKLLRRALRAEAERTARTRVQEDVETTLDQLVAAAPRAQRGQMLLLPWPAEDGIGDRLELRRGLFLPGERIPVRRGFDVDLMDVAEIGGPDFPPALIPTFTEVIATDLLQFDVALASQHTTAGFDGRPGVDGPEHVWDSARAGWLSDAKEPHRIFSLDLGAQSLTNRTDDVFPRWIRVQLVVGRAEPESVVLRELGAKETEVTFGRAEAFSSGQMVKLGPEWVQLGPQNGNRFVLQRGLRHTSGVPHPVGEPARAGRMVTRMIRLAHGRDSFGG